MDRIDKLLYGALILAVVVTIAFSAPSGYGLASNVEVEVATPVALKAAPAEIAVDAPPSGAITHAENAIDPR